MAELTRVFVYGTLKQGFPNHKLLSKLSKSQIVKFISNAETVEKYPLVTATQAGIPFLLDYAGRGKHILGEVYEVCDHTLANLDDLEDEGVLYDRKKIQVALTDSNFNQQHIDAFAYVITNGNSNLLNFEFLSNFTHEIAKHYCPKTDRTIIYQDILKEVKGQ
ncbi:putative gamma-glutamylcyclotransferase CG2811 [Rhopilema esculentum]|uniref:putative gamma-glutamylcyclotransferase CG2811 n=1 Tax=Rhopilema esculentum TaxID=499914 RepID=UPI0031D35179|eukprot:gene15420-6661_t